VLGTRWRAAAANAWTHRGEGIPSSRPDGKGEACSTPVSAGPSAVVYRAFCQPGRSRAPERRHCAAVSLMAGPSKQPVAHAQRPGHQFVYASPAPPADIGTV